MKDQRPRYALRFLRWFCREDYLEEIEGDLTELFEKESARSRTRASWLFRWNVLKYFRPRFMKSFNFQNNSNLMLRHNLTITYRSAVRYKMSFFINLGGLAIGLACAILIYLW